MAGFQPCRVEDGVKSNERLRGPRTNNAEA